MTARRDLPAVAAGRALYGPTTVRRRRLDRDPGRVRKYRSGMVPEQLALVAALRAVGGTWVQIAVAVVDQFGVNRLVAIRLAHGWSQRDAADEWCRRWPQDIKTFKNFSYWEMWPSRTGYAPSLWTLARLAELYECAVADLVADHANFRHLDRPGIAEPADFEQLTIGEQCPHGCTVLAYARHDQTDRDTPGVPVETEPADADTT